MRTLNLTFKGNLGKKHLLKLSYASGNLSADAVRQAMDQIANAHAFSKGDEEDIYAKPIAAKYVDTVSTVLFNDEKKEAPAA